MKTRNGFVSNSSSSSFVVERYDSHSKGTPKITTTAQDRLLKKKQFRLELAYYPKQAGTTHPEMFRTELEKKEFDDISNWCKYVICNQDDEIYFLLKAHISFMADIHYEHYSMIYDGETDKLLIAQNFGKQALMAGTDKLNFAPWKDVPGVEKTTGKAYLKKYES